MSAIKKIIPLFLFSLAASSCFAQNAKINVPYQSIKDKFILIGALGKPFGTPLTVKGIVVDYFSKRGDDGPNIIVQSINDSAIQSFIQIPIKDFLGKVTDDPIANLTYGATYRFKVYETADFIGIPYKMYFEEPFVKITAVPDTANGMTEVVVPGYVPQSSGFNFQNELIAKYGEKIELIEWSPEQFVGRDALLSGIAKNEGDTPVIQNTPWKLQLVGCRKWADAAIGKLAEVYGKVSETAIQGTYMVKTAWARLVKLEDQLGQTVKLRGKAISSNGNWWFNYMGTDIYVENMAKLPNWTVDNDFRSMEITGTLEQEELPLLNSTSFNQRNATKMYYIVKNASWTSIDELLLPELVYDKYGIQW